jgi:hypothetical protein
MRAIWLLLVLIASCALVIASPAPNALGQRVTAMPAEGRDWRAFAERYLLTRAGEPFRARIHTQNVRCIRLNNYPCLWQRTPPLPGTPTAGGTDGAHDGAGGRTGHAIFAHPKWSIVAAMRWFERRTSGGREPKSAVELAEIYSPWCDTLGSARTKADRSGRLWGRSCSGGKRPPQGFQGPTCRKPAFGAPSARQCQACNCPSNAAAAWVRGMGVQPTAKLALFDAAGQPTEQLGKLVGGVIALENGRYRPTDALLTEARASFGEGARR